ncbi:MAG: zinc-ribbon domain-containing protein [Anaerolineales bacterium]
MDIVALLLTLAVLILVGAYLYAPFLRGYGKRVTDEERELSALLAERERVLDSLQELDFDFKLGKIPEGEYPGQRASLLQKGADILRKIDALSVEHPREAAKTSGNELTDAQIEAMISKRRAERKGTFEGFCPKCGKPVMANDRFCPSCGKSLQ